MTKNISMEILLEELEPIAAEINQLESRHTNNIDWTFLHVQLLNIPIWGTQIEFVPSKRQF